MVHKRVYRKFQDLWVKGIALAILILLITNIAQTTAPTIKPTSDHENTDTSTRSRTTDNTSNETISTFSDGTSVKKFVFGNIPPLNGTADLRIPKDANITKAVMNVTGLVHNICLNASGENPGDNFGRSVSYAGDVNNDGYDDIIVGAPKWSASKGRVYIYYGSKFEILSTPHAISGENASDNFGESVSYAGDVNNDGYDDIIIGAPNWQNGVGRVYVFHGSADGIIASSASEANATRTGSKQENFGASVSNAGDVNNDGYDDIVIGSPSFDRSIPPTVDAGKVYIFCGSSNGIESSPRNTMIGKNENATFGNSVSNAGDLNNDGYDDIIIGAIGEFNEKGKVFVYYGWQHGIDSNNPQEILGENNEDYFGCSVSYAGDVNNDGYGDMVAGAKGHDPIWVGENAGRAYVFHGNADGIQATNAFQANTIINGSCENEALGNSVSYAGDVNNDGYDDVIAGAYHYLTEFGRFYVFHGSSDGILDNWVNSILGENGGYFGVNVSYAGDVNNDGYNDVIVGENEYESGKVYIYMGSLSRISQIPASTFEGSEVGCAFGYSISNAGDVNNDGYDDLIVGEQDWGFYVGRAYVFLGEARGISSTPTTIIQGKGDEYYFGHSVSYAGDVNNDGYDDIVIGSPGNGTEGKNSGTVYVFHGGPNGIVATIADDANAKIDGVNSDSGAADRGDSLGHSVSYAGDVNNDGYDDIVVGAPYYSKKEKGRAYVFYGSSTGIESGYADTIYGEKVDGVEDNCGFGYSVSYAGHINEDVYSDILVGLPWADLNAEDRDAGKVYIYYGPDIFTSDYLTGEAAWGQFGQSVSHAGDVNNDGYDDIIVGAPLFDDWTGRVYIYHGSSSGISNDTVPSTIMDGKWVSGEFGKSVSYAGDVNNNGYDDVIVGADFADARGDQSGEAYVFYSNASGVTASNGDLANLTPKGEGENDRLGISVSCAGDINGDGYDDICIGAHLFKNSSNKAVGRIYVIYGGLRELQWWFYDYIPYNPRVDVGANGTIDWNYSGYYNTTETMNFTSELRDYLAEHQNESIEDHIYVPINVICDSRGTIMLDNLNIEYTIGIPGAPTNISIEFQNGGYQDINITWTLSKGGVKNYAIYRNSTNNCNGTGYQFLSEVPAGTSHYIDSGSGDGDLNNYFYYVQVNATSGNATKNDTQVAKFVRNLPKGRQLISIPLNQSDNNITVVFQTIEGNYDYMEWYDPLNEVDHWVTYASFKPNEFNNLLTVDRTIGVWINMTSHDNLTVVGRVPHGTTIQLYKGWNFVGYPSFTDRTVGDALDGLPYQQVEGYENSPPYYLRIFSDSDIMTAGCGYWIKVTEDCTWMIDKHAIAIPAPPTNINTKLQNVGYQDINITWTLSKDDGNGSEDVKNYAIYRNASYNKDGIGYGFLAEVANGTSYYTDIGAGNGNANNYFYYVQANSTSGKVNKSEEQAGKFVRNLPKGRQLFSIPLNQSDTNLMTVLQTIEGNYDYVQLYDPLDATDHWKTYSTSKPSGFNDLLNIDHKLALWINMTSSDNLTVAGIVSKNITIQLYKGWNFISYASFINRTVEDALSGIPYEKVEGFDGDSPPYYLKILSDSDIMTAGYGYWILVSEDCIWIVEN